MSEKTLQEEMDDLREAWRNLAYELLKPLLPLYRKLGVRKFKPWIEERIVRQRWR